MHTLIVPQDTTTTTTHHPDGSQLFDLGALRPRLQRRDLSPTVPLSEDGFCDSGVSVNLSPDLAMELVLKDRRVSYRGLAELGLGTRQAWDHGALNLIAAAHFPQGIRFYLRSATHLTGVPGNALQIKAPTAPITAWLAHPKTFTIVHNHLRRRLGESIYYFAPQDDLLFAVPADSPALRELHLWTQQQYRHPTAPYGKALCDTPVAFSHGFPQCNVDLEKARISQAA